MDDGTCVAITGASGAGKSLFLRMIADLVPNDGDVRLGADRRGDMNGPAWRRRVIYAGGSAWWGPTVADHFPEDATARVATLVRCLGMDADYLQRPVTTLSTGEAQRLTLVRALVRRPRVLLLDEATSGLDPAGVGRVEDLLRETLASGVTLVLATHDLAQAERLAQARYVMSAGRLTRA